MTDENPYAGQGPVLLDIGGRIGALVVAMPAALEGTEIEIRPQEHRPGTGHHLPHVSVVARPGAGGVRHTAVFPELEEGRYELYQRPSGPVRLRVTVAGGTISYADWPR
ncbi:MAG: phospholipase [Micromonosporaceae bacterium]